MQYTYPGYYQSVNSTHQRSTEYALVLFLKQAEISDHFPHERRNNLLTMTREFAWLAFEVTSGRRDDGAYELGKSG